MQKNWFIILCVVLGAILLLVVASFIMGWVGLCQDDASTTPDTLTVYGQGKVAVAPDIAYVTLGYENSAPSPQAAQTANTERMGQITAAIREMGVAEDDIQQTQFNVYQEYYYGDTPDAQSYRVSNIIKITVRQVSRACDVVAAACGAGANTSYGIAYDVTDRQGAYVRALELARARADEKASALSEELGKKLAGIEEVREYGETGCGGEYMDYGYPGTLLTDYVMETAQGGGLEICAVVYVTYQLE